MVCTKKTPYDNWDYPEERPAFREEEVLQAQKALADYNKHSSVKLYLLSDNENNKEEKSNDVTAGCKKVNISLEFLRI